MSARPLTEGYVVKGGRNHGPSQIVDRPLPPAPISADAIPGILPATACHVPAPEEPRMAAIYAGIRQTIVKAHCADHREHHRCAGAITITRDTITLNCLRCGDLRKILESGK